MLLSAPSLTLSGPLTPVDQARLRAFLRLYACRLDKKDSGEVCIADGALSKPSVYHFWGLSFPSPPLTYGFSASSLVFTLLSPCTESPH